MVKFGFTVKDPEGLRTESAGRMVEEAIKCSSKVTIRKGEKSGDAKLIFHVLTLSIKAGQEVEITVEGEKEREEAVALENFIKEHIV
ncbi:MAG: HPr family phosphocarrier protein [Lachnospiraceae bacterium]|nr:HPr family phosphocarrier protein [Lachnospiraceae bacterium]